MITIPVWLIVLVLWIGLLWWSEATGGSFNFLTPVIFMGGLMFLIAWFLRGCF